MAPRSNYLGRLFSFDNYHATEVQHRISCAWRKFHSLRKELTNKHYSLKSRMRLFNGTITPTILYACTSWTLTNDLALAILRTQRRMLRLIIGTPRRLIQPPQPNDSTKPNTSSDSINTNDHTPTQLTQLKQDGHLELWSDYVQRATRVAEATMTRHNFNDWVTTHYQRKQRWAQHVAKLPTNRWSYLVTNWRPEISESRPVYRRQGRPCKRWHDDIDKL